MMFFSLTPVIKQKLLWTLRLSVYLYIFGHFTPFDEKIISQIFYIGIIIPVVFLARKPDLWELWQSPIVKSLLVYLGYVSTIWLIGGEGSYLRYSFYLLIFFLAIWLLIKNDHLCPERFAYHFYIACISFVLIGLAHIAIATGELGNRPYFEGWMTENPIHICAILAISTIACSFTMVAQNRLWSALAILGITFCIMYVFETRSGYLAIISAGVCYLALNQKKIFQHFSARKLIGLFTLAIVSGLMLYTFDVLSPLTSRGSSYRDAIWEVYLTQYESCNMLIGCGYDFDISNLVFPVKESVFHPHSIYVSQLFYSGLLGLICLIAFLFMTLYQGLKSPSPWFYAFVGACLLYSVNGQYALRPPRNEIWLVLWVSITFINTGWMGRNFKTSTVTATTK